MVKKHEAEVVQCSAVQCSACMYSRSATVMAMKHEAEIAQCSEVKSRAVQCSAVLACSLGQPG